jgi:general secretion pathway protein D
LGFDWYLGQFNMGGGSAVGVGGNGGTYSVPGVPGVPGSQTFPGSPLNGTAIPTTVQSLTSGLNSAGAGPAIATITGIFTNPNFQVVLHALEQRAGYEELYVPEVTTTSGRQTEMRSTQILTIISGFTFQAGTAASTTTGAQ